MKPNTSVAQTHAAKASMASKLNAWLKRSVAILPPPLLLLLVDAGVCLLMMLLLMMSDALLASGELRVRTAREYSLAPAGLAIDTRTKQLSHMDVLSTKALFCSLPNSTLSVRLTIHT